jgi:inorganic triphosphatase YgiF
VSEPRREVEAKLVAPGEAAADRARARLEAGGIAGVKLGRSAVRRYRDRYYDTADSRLARTGVALRLRAVAGKSTLGLKGRAVEVPGGLSRLEIEGEWAPATLAAIGPHLPAGEFEFDPDPGVALSRAGFQVIQDREARRRSWPAAWSGRRCAEIALDEVDFETAAGAVRLVEVEVELLPGAGEELLLELVGALRAAAPELLPWRHSKLATGLAAAALAQGGGLQAGVLGAEELARIDAWVNTRELD